MIFYTISIVTVRLGDLFDRSTNIHLECNRTHIANVFQFIKLRKVVINQGYIGDCVLPEVQEAVIKLEAPTPTSDAGKSKQLTLSTFLSKTNVETEPRISFSESSDTCIDSESDSQ